MEEQSDTSEVVDGERMFQNQLDLLISLVLCFLLFNVQRFLLWTPLVWANCRTMKKNFRGSLQVYSHAFGATFAVTKDIFVCLLIREICRDG